MANTWIFSWSKINCSHFFRLPSHRNTPPTRKIINSQDEPHQPQKMWFWVIIKPVYRVHHTYQRGNSHLHEKLITKYSNLPCCIVLNCLFLSSVYLQISRAASYGNNFHQWRLIWGPYCPQKHWAKTVYDR